MGLFSREPAEKTAYKKALSGMIAKPGEKTFAEMEAASKTWQGGWQGYLYMGLAYQMASGVPYSPEKGKQCRKLATEAVKKVGGKAAEWLNCFYGTMDEDAGNFRMSEEYFPRTIYIRKVITAMLRNFDDNEAVIATEYGIKRDLKFWYPLFKNIDRGGLFKTSSEQMQCYVHSQAILTLLDAYRESKMEKRETLMRISADRWKDTVKKKETTPEVNDMEYLVLGWTLLVGGGPYVDVIAADGGFYQNLRINGWMDLLSCAAEGNMPALHLVASMFESEFKEEICYAYRKIFNRPDADSEKVKSSLFYFLDLSIEKGDKTAVELMDALRK